MAEEFEKYWKTLMNVARKKGFYRGILTKPVTMSDAKFNTWSINDPNYRVYINRFLEQASRILKERFKKRCLERPKQPIQQAEE